MNWLKIGAYYLAPCASTPEHVKDLAACGIDLVMNMRNDRATLDLLVQHGVGAVVSGVVPGWFGGDGSNAGTMVQKNPLEKYVSAAERFQDHPAIWGIDAGDEPSSLDFPHYGMVVDTIAERFPGKMPYLNIYPSYGVKGSNTRQEIVQQLGTESYAEYIDRFVRYVNVPYICFDYYLYSADLAGLYESLTTVSEACRRHDRSMWMVLQVNSHQPDVWISEEQLRFQSDCALAFGAQMIIWACYCPGWWYNHVLDKQGNKTQQYEKLRRVNERLHHIGETYMQYRHVNTCFIGAFLQKEIACTGKNVMEKLDTEYFQNLHACGGKMIVGVMNSREGKRREALYIVPTEEKRCMLQFQSIAERVYAVDEHGIKELMKNKDGRYVLELDNCQAVLLTME